MQQGIYDETLWVNERLRWFFLILIKIKRYFKGHCLEYMYMYYFNLLKQCYILSSCISIASWECKVTLFTKMLFFMLSICQNQLWNFCHTKEFRPSLNVIKFLCKSLLRQLHLEIFTDKDIRLFSFLVSFSQGNLGIECHLHFLENRKGSIWWEWLIGRSFLDPTWPGVISLRLCSQCIILQHQSCLAERNKKDVFMRGFFWINWSSPVFN